MKVRGVCRNLPSLTGCTQCAGAMIRYTHIYKVTVVIRIQVWKRWIANENNEVRIEVRFVLHLR